MEKYRGYIILGALLSTFVIVILLINFITIKDNDDSEAPALSYTKKISYIKTNEMFTSINDAINNYMKIINKDSNNISYLLDEKYLLDNDNSSFNDIISKYINKAYRIKSISYIDDSANMYVFISLYLYNNDNKKSIVYMMLSVDFDNNTYSVTPLTKNNFSQVKKDYLEEMAYHQIEKNDYNSYSLGYSDDLIMCAYYLSDLKKLSLYDRDSMYYKLSDKKFANQEEFNKYIDGIKDLIKNGYIVKYSYSNGLFNCQDNNNILYVFKSENIYDYSYSITQLS